MGRCPLHLAFCSRQLSHARLTTTARYAGRNTREGGTGDGNFRIRDLVTRGWLIVARDGLSSGGRPRLQCSRVRVARDRAVCVRQFMVRGIGATFGRQISMGKIPTHFVGVELACDVTGTPLGANKQALNETLGSRRDAGIALFFFPLRAQASRNSRLAKKQEKKSQGKKDNMHV